MCSSSVSLRNASYASLPLAASALPPCLPTPPSPEQCMFCLLVSGCFSGIAGTPAPPAAAAGGSGRQRLQRGCWRWTAAGMWPVGLGCLAIAVLEWCVLSFPVTSHQCSMICLCVCVGGGGVSPPPPTSANLRMTPCPPLPLPPAPPPPHPTPNSTPPPSDLLLPPLSKTPKPTSSTLFLSLKAACVFAASREHPRHPRSSSSRVVWQSTPST
jgi:hypothetical protein